MIYLITGPQSSGKTTKAKEIIGNQNYVTIPQYELTSRFGLSTVTQHTRIIYIDELNDYRFIKDIMMDEDFIKNNTLEIHRQGQPSLITEMIDFVIVSSEYTPEDFPPEIQIEHIECKLNPTPKYRPQKRSSVEQFRENLINIQSDYDNKHDALEFPYPSYWYNGHSHARNYFYFTKGYSLKVSFYGKENKDSVKIEKTPVGTDTDASAIFYHPEDYRISTKEEFEESFEEAKKILLKDFRLEYIINQLEKDWRKIPLTHESEDQSQPEYWLQLGKTSVLSEVIEYLKKELQKYNLINPQELINSYDLDESEILAHQTLDELQDLELNTPNPIP